jgi:hypothetical protein
MGISFKLAVKQEILTVEIKKILIILDNVQNLNQMMTKMGIHPFNNIFTQFQRTEKIHNIKTLHFSSQLV